MSIQEIKAAIAELPPQQRQLLYQELAEEMRREAASEKPLSFHDLAKGFIGPGSGIPDLATNPKYMEDYGTDSIS